MNFDVWIVNLGSNTVTKKEMRDYRSSNADNYSAIIINVFIILPIYDKIWVCC